MISEKNVQYFLAVANEHSITIAAQKLFITQPSLSQAIKRMEDAIGTPLFKRTLTGLQLTDTGKQFYSAAMQSERIWQNFSINLTAPDELKVGTLSFGITMQLGLLVLPDILIRFNKQFPHMNCDVYDYSHSLLQGNLLSGDIDLAVTHIQAKQSKPNFYYETFLRDPFVVITSPSHSFSNPAITISSGLYGPEIDIRQLKEEKFIYTKAGNQTRDIIDPALARAGITAPKEYLTNNQYQTIQALASNGLGIGIIPRSYIMPCYDLNVYYFPEEYEAYWDFCIMTRNSYVLTSMEKRLTDLIKEICVSKWGTRPPEVSVPAPPGL